MWSASLGSRGVRLALAAIATAVAGSAQAQPAPGPPLSPAKGDVVPAFDTVSIDGKARSVGFPRGSKTMLLFFLSGCPVCHKMIPEWNSAYQRRPKGLNVVGVIMDQEPPGFFSTLSIQFPVVRAPGRQFLRSLHVTHAPLTLRVVGGGRIEDLALGRVDPIRLGELFRP
jgi:peroxiredoxin